MSNEARTWTIIIVALLVIVILYLGAGEWLASNVNCDDIDRINVWPNCQ